MWLNTTMQPPVAGILLPSTQVRETTASSGGLSRATAMFHAQPRFCDSLRTFTCHLSRCIRRARTSDTTGAGYPSGPTWQDDRLCRGPSWWSCRSSRRRWASPGSTRWGRPSAPSSPRRSPSTPPRRPSPRRGVAAVVVACDDPSVAAAVDRPRLPGGAGRRRAQRDPRRRRRRGARPPARRPPGGALRRPAGAALDRARRRHSAAHAGRPRGVRGRCRRHGDDDLRRAVRRRSRPAFGPALARAAPAAGAVELAGELPGLRRDVDDPADLDEAVALGVGPHTAAVLGRLA